MTPLTNTRGFRGAAFLPKTGFPCSSWKVPEGVLAASTCILKVCGARCATTCGTRMKQRWCAGSWGAEPPSRLPERPTLAGDLAPSFWTTCSALGPRPLWGSAPMPAGSPTTVGTGKMLASSAPVNVFLSSRKAAFSCFLRFLSFSLTPPGTLNLAPIFSRLFENQW